VKPQERHNAICNVAGEIIWGFQWSLVPPATVLTVLLLQLGARQSTVGLLPMLDGIMLMLQLVGIYLFRERRTRRVRIVAWHYVAMLPFLGLIGVLTLLRSHISPETLIITVMASWAAYMLTMGVVIAAWQDWVAHLFHEGIRGRVTGLAWGLSNLAGVASALLAGRILKAYPDLSTFGWLYLTAAVLGTVSISVFLAVRDPAEQECEESVPSLRDMVSAARLSLRTANFRAVLIGRCLAYAGFCVGPYITMHYLSDAGGRLPGALLVSLGAAQTLGSAVACIGFGRLGDRIGHRFGVLTGTVFQIACLLCVLLIPGPLGCLLAMVFAGGVGGALMISYMNIVIESCPHNIRSAHLAIGNIVLGVTAMVIPFLGSRLAGAYGIRTLMACSLTMSIVAAIWIAWKVRDPRHIRAKPAAAKTPTTVCVPAASEETPVSLR